MQVLKDPESTQEALREAAYNLAHLGDKRVIATTVFSSHTEEESEEINPAIEKYKDPTTAEAILAAMDRDLAIHDEDKDDELYDYRRDNIEDEYIFALIYLGDKGIL